MSNIEFNVIATSEQAKEPNGEEVVKTTVVEEKEMKEKEKASGTAKKAEDSKTLEAEAQPVSGEKKNKPEEVETAKATEGSTAAKANDSSDGRARAVVDTPQRPLAELARPRMTVDQAKGIRQRNMLREIDQRPANDVFTTPRRALLVEQDRPAPRLPTPEDKRGPKVPLVVRDVVLQRDEAASMLNHAMALQKAEQAARALREAAEKEEQDCRRERIAIEAAVAQLVSPARNEAGAHNIAVLQSTLRRAQARVSSVAGNEFARARVVTGDRSAPELHTRQMVDRRNVFETSAYREMRLAERATTADTTLPQLLSNFSTFSRILHTVQARKHGQQLLPKQPRMVVASPNTSVVKEETEPTSPTLVELSSDNDDDDETLVADVEEGEEEEQDPEELLVRLINTFDDEPSFIERIVMEGVATDDEEGEEDEQRDVERGEEEQEDEQQGVEERVLVPVEQVVPLPSTRPEGSRLLQHASTMVFSDEKHWALVPFQPRQPIEVSTPVTRDDDFPDVEQIVVLMDLLKPMPYSGTTRPEVARFLRQRETPLVNGDRWAVVQYVNRQPINMMARNVVRPPKRCSQEDVGPAPKRCRASGVDGVEQLTVVVLNTAIWTGPTVPRLLRDASGARQWAVVPFVPRFNDMETMHTGNRATKRTSQEQQGPEPKRRRDSQGDEQAFPIVEEPVSEDGGYDGEDEGGHSDETDVKETDGTEDEVLDDGDDIVVTEDDMTDGDEVVIVATPPPSPIQRAPTPPPAQQLASPPHGSAVPAGRQPAVRGWGRLPGERLRRRSGLLAPLRRPLGPLPATVQGRIERELRRVDNFLLNILDMLEDGGEEQLNDVLGQQLAARRALTTLRRLHSKGAAATIAEVEKAVSRLENSNREFFINV